MAIGFKDVQGVSDILNVDKQVIYFPNIPGNGSAAGDALTIRHSDASFPPAEIGQVIVKLQGWSRAFAGRRVVTNTMSVSFYEDKHGTASLAIQKWMNVCSGVLKAGGKLSNDYAVNAELKAEDTVGNPAIIYRINKMWPMRMQIPPYTSDASAPMKIEVDFSVDSMDIVGIVDSDGNAQIASGVSSDKRLPGVNYTKQASMELTLPQLNVGFSSRYNDIKTLIRNTSNSSNTSNTLRGLTNKDLQRLSR
jgi:hypothetical protein